jgi:hypothetical protein
MIVTMNTIILSFFSFMSVVAGHGDHDQAPMVSETDWASQHMNGMLCKTIRSVEQLLTVGLEEHHIQGFDATTFFTLHDFSASRSWSGDDIRRMYGLFDESTSHIDEEHKIKATQQVLDIYDTDKDGHISLEEFLAGWEGKGMRLPDLGFGPGHHGDDEYEYEIHHWEKYHGDDTKLEDLTHPEDIAHFKKHEEEEKREEEWEVVFAAGIVEANIPNKYRREE